MSNRDCVVDQRVTVFTIWYEDDDKLKMSKYAEGVSRSLLSTNSIFISSVLFCFRFLLIFISAKNWFPNDNLSNEGCECYFVWNNCVLKILLDVPLLHRTRFNYVISERHESHEPSFIAGLHLR